MDVLEPLSSKEHYGCSFDDLLSEHRTSLLSQVDSLRSVVQKFDEKCRSHLSSWREHRRRSDGDASTWGWHSLSRAVDIGLEWTTTSGSDTDESVVEVCAATRKMRQTRGTQTNLTRCSCQRKALNHHHTGAEVSMRDVAIQTVDHGFLGNSTDQLEKKIASKQLLGVLEVLAMQRRKNGRHRSSVRKTSQNMPVDWRSKGSNLSILELRSAQQTALSCLQDSIHNQVTVDERNLYTEADEEMVGNENENQKVRKPKRRKIHPDGSEVEDDCGAYREDSHGIYQDSATDKTDLYALDDTSYHTVDDLWRLAEEGRLPWTCDLIKTPSMSKGRDDDVCPSSSTRLLYCCERSSLFGPPRIFRRCKPRRNCLPPWRWISVPPILGVIQEH